MGATAATNKKVVESQFTSIIYSLNKQKIDHQKHSLFSIIIANIFIKLTIILLILIIFFIGHHTLSRSQFIHEIDTEGEKIGVDILADVFAGGGHDTNIFMPFKILIFGLLMFLLICLIINHYRKQKNNQQNFNF